LGKYSLSATATGISSRANVKDMEAIAGFRGIAIAASAVAGEQER
jgi:hypothetical protein